MADRNDPMVQAWIAEYERVNGNSHEDCRSCGWPHPRNLMCNVATFGLAIIGGDHYPVKGQNVDYLLGFRRNNPARGFHWRDDVCFERTDEGVRVSRIERFNNTPHVKSWLIAPLEWESIVSALTVMAAPVDHNEVMALVYLYGSHCAEHPEDAGGQQERLAAIKAALGVLGGQHQTKAPSDVDEGKQ